MTANELRIGNYVHGALNIFNKQSGDYDIVTGLGNQIEVKIDGLRYNLHPDLVLPIQLTEEWLNKIMLDNKWHRLVAATSTIGKAYVFESATETLGVNTITWNAVSVVCYVHQLQNLYFALAGTELTIKE